MRAIFSTVMLVAVSLTVLGCNQATKDQLTAEQQSAITAMQDKLNNLKARMDVIAADAKTTTTDATQRATDELRTAWNNAQDKLSHLKTASAAEWERDRGSIESSLDDLSRKLDDWAAKMKSSINEATAPTTVPTAPSPETVPSTR